MADPTAPTPDFAALSERWEASRAAAANRRNLTVGEYMQYNMYGPQVGLNLEYDDNFLDVLSAHVGLNIWGGRDFINLLSGGQNAYANFVDMYEPGSVFGLSSEFIKGKRLGPDPLYDYREDPFVLNLPIELRYLFADSESRPESMARYAAHLERSNLARRLETNAGKAFFAGLAALPVDAAFWADLVITRGMGKAGKAAKAVDQLLEIFLSKRGIVRYGFGSLPTVRTRTATALREGARVGGIAFGVEVFNEAMLRRTDVERTADESAQNVMLASLVAFAFGAGAQGLSNRRRAKLAVDLSKDTKVDTLMQNYAKAKLADFVEGEESLSELAEALAELGISEPVEGLTAEDVVRLIVRKAMPEALEADIGFVTRNTLALISPVIAGASSPHAAERVFTKMISSVAVPVTGMPDKMIQQPMDALTRLFRARAGEIRARAMDDLSGTNLPLQRKYDELAWLISSGGKYGDEIRGLDDATRLKFERAARRIMDFTNDMDDLMKRVGFTEELSNVRRIFDEGYFRKAWDGTAARTEPDALAAGFMAYAKTLGQTMTQEEAAELVESVSQEAALRGRVALMQSRETGRSIEQVLALPTNYQWEFNGKSYSTLDFIDTNPFTMVDDLAQGLAPRLLMAEKMLTPDSKMLDDAVEEANVILKILSPESRTQFTETATEGLVDRINELRRFVLDADVLNALGASPLQSDGVLADRLRASLPQRKKIQQALNRIDSLLREERSHSSSIKAQLDAHQNAMAAVETQRLPTQLEKALEREVDNLVESSPEVRRITSLRDRKVDVEAKLDKEKAQIKTINQDLSRLDRAVASGEEELVSIKNQLADEPEELTEDLPYFDRAFGRYSEGAKYFKAPELRRQVRKAGMLPNEPRPKSKMILVYMSPQEYLEVAKPWRHDQPGAKRLKSLNKVLENDGKFDTIPELLLEGEGNNIRVVNSDGRYRAKILMDRKVERMPVLMSHKTLKWAKVQRGFRGTWFQTLRGMDPDKSIGFPVRDPRPTRGRKPQPLTPMDLEKIRQRVQRSKEALKRDSAELLIERRRLERIDRKMKEWQSPQFRLQDLEKSELIAKAEADKAAALDRIDALTSRTERLRRRIKRDEVGEFASLRNPVYAPLSQSRRKILKVREFAEEAKVRAALRHRRRLARRRAMIENRYNKRLKQLEDLRNKIREASKDARKITRKSVMKRHRLEILSGARTHMDSSRIMRRLLEAGPSRLEKLVDQVRSGVLPADSLAELKAEIARARAKIKSLRSERVRNKALIKPYMDLLGEASARARSLGRSTMIRRQGKDMNMSNLKGKKQEKLAKIFDREMSNLTGALIKARRSAFADAESALLIQRSLRNEGANKATMQRFEQSLIKAKGLPLITRDPSDFVSSASVALRGLTAVTGLGNIVLSQFGDMVAKLLVHGLSTYARGLRMALTHPIDMIFGPRGNREEAVRMIAALESMQGGSVAEILQGFGPYVYDRGRIARVAAGGAWLARKALLADWMNSRTKALSGMMAMDELLRAIKRGPTSAEMVKFRAYGMSEEMMGRIREQVFVRNHGELDRSIYYARADRWDDRQAARAFNAYLFNITQSAVVTPGAMDLPAAFSSPVGAFFLQFKSFSVAAANRIGFASRRIAHNQGGKQALAWYANALLGSYAVGWTILKAKNTLAGRPDEEITVLDAMEVAGVLGIIGDAGLIIGNAMGTESAHQERVISSQSMIPSLRVALAGTRVASAIYQRMAAGTPLAASDYKNIGTLTPGYSVFYLQAALRLANEARYGEAAADQRKFVENMAIYDFNAPVNRGD